MSMKIMSDAFASGVSIPKKYTCDGENINPPLTILDVPHGTASLALIMEDPDVPKNIRKDGMWDHWIVCNIAPEVQEIVEGVEPVGVLGIGTGGILGYQGPCPPDKEHRYVFTLYALDRMLDVCEGVSKIELERSMKECILDRAQLTGLYDRKR